MRDALSVCVVDRVDAHEGDIDCHVVRMLRSKGTRYALAIMMPRRNTRSLVATVFPYSSDGYTHDTRSGGRVSLHLQLFAWLLSSSIPIQQGNFVNHVLFLNDSCFSDYRSDEGQA